MKRQYTISLLLTKRESEHLSTQLYVRSGTIENEEIKNDDATKNDVIDEALKNFNVSEFIKNGYSIDVSVLMILPLIDDEG